jgi:hypothetical protein
MEPLITPESLAREILERGEFDRQAISMAQASGSLLVIQIQFGLESSQYNHRTIVLCNLVFGAAGLMRPDQGSDLDRFLLSVSNPLPGKTGM